MERLLREENKRRNTKKDPKEGASLTGINDLRVGVEKGERAVVGSLPQVHMQKSSGVRQSSHESEEMPIPERRSEWM